MKHKKSEEKERERLKFASYIKISIILNQNQLIRRRNNLVDFVHMGHVHTSYRLSHRG